MARDTMERRYALIEAFCAGAEETDPLVLAEALMRRPEIRFHGPEHHYLTAAVLSSVWCRKHGEPPEPHLKRLRARCAQIPPGVCGYFGVCGNTMAAGAALSELLGVTYLSGENWKRLNAFTARVQRGIADSCGRGPRCCKRTTFAALLAAYELLELREPGFRCPFSGGNPQCIGTQCVFFPQTAAGGEMSSSNSSPSISKIAPDFMCVPPHLSSDNPSESPS